MAALLVLGVLSTIAVPTFNAVKGNSMRRTLVSSAQGVAENANAQAGSAGRGDTTDEDVERAVGETEYAEFDEDLGVSVDIDPGDRFTWLAGTNRLLYVAGSFCSRVTVSLQPLGSGDVIAQASASEECSDTFDSPGTPLISFDGTTNPTISWTAPATVPDAAALTDYRIEVNAGSGWVTFADPVSTATSAQITGLTPGPVYRFRVVAISNLSDGPTSGESAPLDLLPVTPTGVGVAAASAALNISWSPSSATSSWTATTSPGGFTCTGSGTGCGITGLVNGTRYSVTVTAANSFGSSSPSAAISRVPGSPANDDLTQATAVAYLPGGTSTSYTAVFAGTSTEVGEPSSSYNRTAWWKYTNSGIAPQRLTVTFPINVRADVYDGTTWVSKIVQAGPSGRVAGGALVVRVGQTVSVRLDSTGTPVLIGFSTVDLPAWNDNLSAAVTLNYLADGASVTVSGDFTGSTVEPGEPASSNGRTLWWRYTNTGAVPQRLNMSFPINTRVDVYSGTTWTTKLMQAGPSGSVGSGSATVNAGQTVTIRVDGTGSQVGIVFSAVNLSG